MPTTLVGSRKFGNVRLTQEPELCRPLNVCLEALFLTICGLTPESHALTQVSTHTRPFLRALFHKPSVEDGVGDRGDGQSDGPEPPQL